VFVFFDRPMKSIEHDESQKRIISNQQPAPPLSWDSTNGSDVYKEKWFHGKISRDDVTTFSIHSLRKENHLCVFV